MTKPKSEKTLAREKAWADAVAAYEKTAKLDQYMDANFFLRPGKIKSPHADVVIRKARLKPRLAAQLRLLKETLAKNGYNAYFKVQYNSYLFGTGILKYDNYKNLKVICPSMYILTSHQTDIVPGKLSIKTMKATKDPATMVHNHTFPDEAVAMTWPDEMGMVQVYIHLGSKAARMKVPKLAFKEADGLNREAVSKHTDWDILHDYIGIRKSMSLTIPQRTICDIVKIVSNNLSEKALNKMAASNG